MGTCFCTGRCRETGSCGGGPGASWVPGGPIWPRVPYPLNPPPFVPWPRPVIPSPPKIKRIEYNEDGSIRSIEYYE